MVSFFGLKLGGDKKKSNDKQKPPPRSIQRPNDKSTTPDPPITRERRLTNNYSRPNFARPGTASSNYAGDAAEWRAPYAGGSNSAAVSSMVDLATPRAPGLGNPRFHSSDNQLNARFTKDGSPSLTSPGLIGGSKLNSPRSPNRPGTAISINTNTKRDWDNPFQVHFAGPGSTPVSPSHGKNSLEQFEFGLGSDNNTTELVNPAGNGYPSPPPSILSADQPIPPVNPDNRPGSSRRNGPSGLRNMETTGPQALPSPAASVLRTSEETLDIPVIRNVQAKRDTLTFHTPRRQSFTMEVDGMDKGKGKPMTEGLAGNFTGFDFGESVRRGSVSHSVDSISPISPLDIMKSKPFAAARTASPLRSMQSSPSLSGEERIVTRQRNTSDAPSALSNVSTQESVLRESPILTQSLSVPLVSTPTQPVLQPASQFSPQPALSPTMQHASPPTLQTSRGPSPHPPVKLQYHDIPLALRTPAPPPAPPPTGPIPPTPTNARSNTVPPVSAYGAQPGYMSRPLDPPPPGFRSRVDSNPQRQPNGLRVPPPLVDRFNKDDGSSLRSPFGPPPEEGNYIRTGSSPSPRLPPEARAQSPFSRPPIEGDFPVQKGLPRGRRPPALELHAQKSGAWGSKIQQRQRPMYPTQAESSPTMSSEMSKEESAEDHGYTLPNWDDFDTASPRRSAVPAPLYPMRGDHQAPHTPPADDGVLSPLRHQFTSSPISPKPPSLPSPSFSSLQKSISSSSENLAKSFELVEQQEADAAAAAALKSSLAQSSIPRNRPLISPVMVEFSRSLSPATMRVEAKKAPPRPNNPIVVPASKETADRLGARTPKIAVNSSNPGFI
ncbi:hypothetical protein BGZ63DRAFT_399493 [Mariannaea sp. PMI_226]|nr:hypothetical protein BGZ63DRAFT_399493 [Mariannaea sp. PMI_226]